MRQFLLKNLEWKDNGQLGWKFNLPVLEAQMSRIGQALAPEDRYIGSTLFVRGARSGYILDEDWSGIMDHFPPGAPGIHPRRGPLGARRKTGSFSGGGFAVFARELESSGCALELGATSTRFALFVGLVGFKLVGFALLGVG